MSAEFIVNLPAALVQLEAYYAANWAVTDWYIDGVVGSDSNTGTSAAAPLKTGAELQRRIGTYAKWDHSVTIHVLANGMTDPLIVRGKFSGTSMHVEVIGTPTVLVSDVLSSYLALNHATPRATEIVGTAITDFTAYVGSRIRIPSGARVGWTSWIAKASPNGVGLNTARISPGAALNKTSTSTIWTASTPVANDPIVIESLPQIPQIVVELDGPWANSGGPSAWSRIMHSIDSVACSDIFVRCSSADNYNGGVIFGSKIANAVSPYAHNRDFSLFLILGCYLQPNYVNNHFLKTPVRYSLLMTNSGGAVSISDRAIGITACLLQNCGVVCYIPAYLSNVQIFDATGAPGSGLYVLDSVIANNVSGAQNVSGIELRNGGRIGYNDTLNLKGTTDCLLGSAPTISLTQAQFMQPNDYAQKGTATLVGGTVTVTVPWYENTIQKVTVTRVTPGGTIGDLSVAQISNSQFTITSASALDTSTVNWNISPLGRGVNIVKYG